LLAKTLTYQREYILLLIFQFSFLMGISQPVANFSANKTQGCAPLLVQFSDLSTQSPHTYFWEFGNGNTSTLQNPSATFVTAGTYSIKLTVSNANGTNEKTIQNYITIYPLPNVNFGSNRNLGCVPLSVQFRDSSSATLSSIVNWSWDFGNGNTSNQKNPITTFTQARQYHVSLMVTDANGCSNAHSKTNYIQALAAPSVNFTANKVFDCNKPFTSTFNAQVSPAGAYNYLWDFGNASQSALPNPTATYHQFGNYTVNLRVINSAQCTIHVAKPNFIQIADVVPDFRLIDSSILCESTRFLVLNTTNFNARVFSNSWKLNDSVVSNFRDLHLTKLPAGSYSVSLQVSSGSCTTSVTKPLFISVQAGPKSRFSADTLTHCKLPARVQFRDSSLNAISWFWDFGNGQTSTQRHPLHTYTTHGDYTVKLVTTSSNGCTDTAIYKSYVLVRPVHIIPILSKVDGCPPLEVMFSKEDTNFIRFTDFVWMIGEKGDSMVPFSNTKFTYLKNGVYYVRLTATNARGCSSTRIDSIMVGGNVHVDFMAEKRVYCNDEQPIVFTNTSINPGLDVIYNWDYGDTSRILKFSGNEVTYKDTGLFTVTLTAIYRGCETVLTRTDYVRVNAPISKFAYKQPNCDKRYVEFENLSKGGHLFRWDWGIEGDSSFYDTLTEIENFTPFQYDSNGTYIVKLEITDTITGCVDMFTDTLRINHMVEPSFTISSMKGCNPMELRLKNTTKSSFPLRFCLFKIGERFYGGDSITITLTTPGKFPISMYVTDHQNCIFGITLTDSIEVFGAQMKLKATPVLGCAPLLVQFTDSSRTDNPFMRRIWNFGNGDSISSSQRDSIQIKYSYIHAPIHQDSGYIMQLTVVDSFGCRFSQTQKIIVSQPRPDFTIRQVRTCLQDSFIFSPIQDKLIGLMPLTYFWEMDGHKTLSRNLTKIYNQDTSILVKLMAFDSYGCIDTIAKQISLKVGPPKVDFDAFPKQINCPGPPVYFTDYSSAGSSPIVKWQWDFSDGIASTIQNPSRLFLKAGSYSAQLSLTDSLGCTASKSISNIVFIGGPSGSYDISPLTGCLPLQVNFNVISSPNTQITWDFGDGNIDTVAQTKYVYKKAGRFIPYLSITDADGCKIGFEPKDTIEVFESPIVDFSVDKWKSCLGDEVLLTGTVKHDKPILAYRWNIDGNILNTLGPHTYKSARIGNIPASFEVSDAVGCIAKKDDSVAFQVFNDKLAPAVPFVYAASVISDEQVSFTIAPNKEADFDFYEIKYDWNGTQFLKSRWVQNQLDTVQLFANLNTLLYTYSFAALAKDVCGNWSEPTRTHTTIELKAEGIENANALSWTAYQGWDTVHQYAVYRFNERTQLFEEIAKLSGNERQFIDSNITCKVLHRYKILATQVNRISWSDTAAAIPIYKPIIPPSQMVRATVYNQTKVLISWWSVQHKYPFKFVLYKQSSMPQGPLERIELAQEDTFYIDDKVNVQSYSYTYELRVEDACGGVGMVSNKAKTILLNLNMQKNDRLSDDPILTWSAYEKWHVGVEKYDLFFYNDSLGVKEKIVSRGMLDSLYFKHSYLSLNQDDYCYEVLAYKQDSNWVQSLSNRVCIETLPRLFAPNAFTCNNDQLNDGFLVQGVFITQFELRIYNRWGELVFETKNMQEPWDGTFNGKPAPADVYVYTATGYGRKNRVKTIQGNVTLLR